MFNKSAVRGKLFLRYLVSYLVLVLIPLIIIGCFYSVSFYHAFSNEVFLNVEKDLQNTADSIDSQLSILSDTVQQISISSQLKSLKEFDSEKVNDMKQLLSNYNSTNPFTEDIYLTLPRVGYVLSTTTSSQYSYFMNRIFQMQGVSSIEMDAFFQSPVPTIMPVGQLNQFGLQAKQSILFSYPIYQDSLQQVGNLVFNVPYEAVQKLLHKKLSIYHAKTFFFCKDLNLIASAGNTSYLEAIMTEGREEKPFQFLSALNKEYVIREVLSADKIFHCLTLIPRNQQSFNRISQMNYLFLLSVLIILAVSGMVIIYALRINYSPLRRLQSKAGQLAGGNTSHNEINDIEEALDLLNGRNLYLTAKLEDSADSTTTARLRKLLTNGYDSAEDFNLDCKELDLKLYTDFFFITTSYIHTAGTDLNMVGHSMKQFLSDSMYSYFLQPLESNKLIMLHSLTAEQLEHIGPISDVFAALHNRLAGIHDILITTGIGSIVNKTTDISSSYLESSAALDYRFVKGIGQIISFSEISFGTTGRLTYPQQTFEKLKNSLYGREEDVVNQCIDEIIEIIAENKYPLSAARGICFNLIHLVTNTAHDEASGKPFTPANVFALSEVETIQDLVSILKNWRQEIKTVVAPSPEQAVTLDKVMDYLKAHCLECNFSIYETAAYFGMQLPKFSQYFKEQTRQNVMDFTIQVRMNEAARLLTETNLDINDIAKSTGYYSTSSFIRRFKQIRGVTPGDYRKRIGKGKQ